VRWLDAHEDVGALAPLARDAAGRRVYLCKRYPAIFDLFLRGFAPALMRRIFRGRLDRYEMRDILGAEPPEDVIGIPALSGAFMLVKRFAIDQTGGFDPKFFLYFEDFDWSVRLNRITRTAFVLARRDAVDRTGGFDPRFFLYFEDFDWSVRLNEVARNAYVPSVSIVHHGGGAARKGWRHIAWFIRSGFRFYAKHGWRWL
jgi:GT2 family glycosyltransferase